jgi:hypothetical protein
MTAEDRNILITSGFRGPMSDTCPHCKGRVLCHERADTGGIEKPNMGICDKCRRWWRMGKRHTLLKYRPTNADIKRFQQYRPDGIE